MTLKSKIKKDRKKKKFGIIKKLLCATAFSILVNTATIPLVDTINKNMRTPSKTAVFTHGYLNNDFTCNDKEDDGNKILPTFFTHFTDFFMYVPVTTYNILNGNKTIWFSNATKEDIMTNIKNENYNSIIFIGHGKGSSFNVSNGKVLTKDISSLNNKKSREFIKYSCGTNNTDINEAIVADPLNSFSYKDIILPTTIYFDAWKNLIERFSKGNFGKFIPIKKDLNVKIVSEIEKNNNSSPNTLERKIFENIGSTGLDIHTIYKNEDSLLREYITNQVGKCSSANTKNIKINVNGVNYTANVSAFDYKSCIVNPYYPRYNNLIVSLNPVNNEIFPKSGCASCKDTTFINELDEQIVLVDLELDGKVDYLYKFDPKNQIERGTCYKESSKHKIFDNYFSAFGGIIEKLPKNQKDFSREVIKKIYSELESCNK